MPFSAGKLKGRGMGVSFIATLNSIKLCPVMASLVDSMSSRQPLRWSVYLSCQFGNFESWKRLKSHFSFYLLLFHITGIFGSQDLQRRLDQERAERNKTDSATLKLLSELKEDSQKANELRDQESRLADKQLGKKSCHNRLVCCCVISTSQSAIRFRRRSFTWIAFRLAKRALLARVFNIPHVRLRDQNRTKMYTKNP